MKTCKHTFESSKQNKASIFLLRDAFYIEYSNSMNRQLLLYFSICTLFIVPLAVEAANPPIKTYVVPPPSKEKKPEAEPRQAIDEGLDTRFNPKEVEPFVPYHLPLKPSVSILLNRTYSTRDSDHDGWIDIKMSPKVGPTSRWQYGFSFREDFLWLQSSWHILQSRNQFRYFYGPHMSIIFPVEDELRPLLRIDQYFLGGIIGFDWQIAPLQNIRLEASVHQGTETTLGRVAVGYTILL